MIYFPQFKAALVVRREAPEGAQFVMKLGAQSVYLIPANEVPDGAEVANNILGGWNFGNGVSVHLVYASTIPALYAHRREVNGKWVVLPRRLSPGKCVGLMLAETGVPVSMGVTPVVVK